MTCACTHKLDQLLDGVDAVDDMLKFFGREPVEKAINILNPQQFLVVVERVARRLNRITRPTEAAAKAAVLSELDVDWTTLSAAGRERALRAAEFALRRAGEEALPQITRVFEAEGPKIARATKKATVRRLKLDIDTSLNLVDEKVAETCVTQQSLFVRNAFGNRVDEFGQVARDTVAAGLNKGLGRLDIAADLERVAAAASLERDLSYWRLISSVFSARARTGVQVRALQEAQVTTYRWLSMMDEATCESCRMMNGTTWPVESAGDLLDQSEDLDDPEDIVDVQPWFSRGKDDDGTDILYYKRKGVRHAIAEVLTPGYGKKDRAGDYAPKLDPDAMIAAGIILPPSHGHCRCTIVID